MAKSKLFPDGWAPEPTVMTGGIARMIKVWESCRDANVGGYKGGVVHTVKGWTTAGFKEKVTSCSPFTATVIGMMFDPSGNTEAGALYEPKYDGGTKPLPPEFYHAHNGFFCSGAKNAWKRARLQELGWKASVVDHSAGSCLFYNLGYAIDPKDMRRGDLVAIHWGSRGGHATFCWDVHLNAADEVDAFLYLSSNGCIGMGGDGVTVGVMPYARAKFVRKKGGKYVKVKNPLFADHPDYIEHGAWEVLPKLSRKDVDKKTFKDPGPRTLVDAGFHPYNVAEVQVTRFWGIAPPTRKQDSDRYEKNFALASKLALEKPPASYATGKGTPQTVHIQDVPVTKQPAKQVQSDEGLKKVPPKPVKQEKKRSTEGQLFVEQALHELFVAGWIAVDPGEPDNVFDAQSKAAVKDFQAKFKALPVDGKPGPITRRALRHALADLHDGKPNPNKPDEAKPKVDFFYWLKNRAEPGGSNTLSVRGKNLGELASLAIELTDGKSGKHVELPIESSLPDQGGTVSLPLPKGFALGAELTGRLKGKGKDGTAIDKSSQVPLYIGEPVE